ncbi:unnamed protein product [Penicillium olsonii]|nr:unnamed protein product [Penicillium olsonii]
MGGFATTLLTLSLAMMKFRGVSVQTVFIGNFCFIGCVALLVSAQWEVIRGNTFSYTVLSLFYGGYGAILLPTLGISDTYGGKTSEYYNAMGFFVLSKSIAFETYDDHLSRNTVWTVLNTIFLVASFSRNMVYFGTFLAIEICFGLDATANLIRADGDIVMSAMIMKIGGVFGFIAGLLGFYITAHDLCHDSLPFRLPMGDVTFLAKAERHIAEEA